MCQQVTSPLAQGVPRAAGVTCLQCCLGVMGRPGPVLHCSVVWASTLQCTDHYPVVSHLQSFRHGHLGERSGLAYGQGLAYGSVLAWGDSRNKNI